MKAKIYPLNHICGDIEATASPFCLHLQIICASLAKGTSTIKNLLDSNDIETTIEWCKSIGANIKKVNDKLIIKGVNNTINYQSSLFVCNTSITAKLMIPLLCSVSQPFGVKSNKAIIKELSAYKKTLESFGVNFFLENEMIRFEKTLNPTEVEIDGDVDIYFIAGLLIALPLLKGPSILKLRAPIRSEKNYSTILKIMKQFRVDIKHPATMRYEISGYQSYKPTTITTETDNMLLCFNSLLTQRLNEDEKVKITNYQSGSTQEEVMLFDFIKKYIVNYSHYLPRRTLKKKNINFHKLEANVENSLPLLMVLSSINSQDSIITRINFSKDRVKKQFSIMAKAFTKLKLDFSAFESEIVVQPCKIKEKKQVDSENDPYVVIALSYLAILSDYPIVIRNADCVYNVNKDFFKMLMNYGVVIDFIYD